MEWWSPGVFKDFPNSQNAEGQDWSSENFNDTNQVNSIVIDTVIKLEGGITEAVKTVIKQHWLFLLDVVHNAR
jgi:hypothetical protein